MMQTEASLIKSRDERARHAMLLESEANRATETARIANESRLKMVELAQNATENYQKQWKRLERQLSGRRRPN